MEKAFGVVKVTNNIKNVYLIFFIALTDRLLFYLPGGYQMGELQLGSSMILFTPSGSSILKKFGHPGSINVRFARDNCYRVGGWLYISGVASIHVNLNLAHVSNDENKVADRSNEDEEVPDTMRVDKISSMVENIKTHAQGVHQAASCKPI